MYWTSETNIIGRIACVGLSALLLSITAVSTAWAVDTVRFTVPFEASNLPDDVQGVEVMCWVRLREGTSNQRIQAGRSRVFSVDGQGQISGTATIVVTPSGNAATRFLPTPNNYICHLNGVLNDGIKCRVDVIAHYANSEPDLRCDNQLTNQDFAMGDL